MVEHLYYNSSSKRYEHSSFAIFAQPYSIENANYFRSNQSYDWSMYAWSGDGQAGRISEFPKNVRVSVTVRVPKNDGGWFSGRITDPIVQLRSESIYNSLTIDALPVTVPKIQAWAPASQKTPLMVKLGMTPGGNHAIESGFDDSINWVDQLRPFAGDQSTSEETLWVVRSTYIRNPCFPDTRISGFVTTNAMAYSWNPPVFKDGFLDYKVGGMHKSSTGELTKGTYDLVLNSETARCLYQFSSAPISATVSIISASGESQSVETTLLTERGGFLKLSAYGFTFSSPTVRVKLTQNSKLAESSNKTNTQSQTITCIRGKISKRVVSVNPICPSGYKKK
jgi:hypothetical protein